MKVLSLAVVSLLVVNTAGIKTPQPIGGFRARGGSDEIADDATTETSHYYSGTGEAVVDADKEEDVASNLLDTPESSSFEGVSSGDQSSSGGNEEQNVSDEADSKPEANANDATGNTVQNSYSSETTTDYSAYQEGTSQSYASGGNSAEEKITEMSSTQPDKSSSFKTSKVSRSLESLRSSLSRVDVKKSLSRVDVKKSFSRVASKTASVVPRPSPSLQGKLKNVQERLLPAVLLLVGLYGIIHFGQEQGLQCLALILAPGLYQEAISVTGASPGYLEWSWFISYACVALLPTALPRFTTDLRITGYVGLVATFVGTVYRLNAGDGSIAEFQTAVSQIAKSHAGFALTAIPCACWVATLANYSQEWVLFAALLVILNDTLAYVFGMTLGKHALLPVISPKKTVEGYLGGGVSTMLLTPVIWNLLFADKLDRHGLIISLFCNTLAPFGGFVASFVKRSFGKKDFGHFIPGHGGLIDRLDCQLLTAPFLFLYLQATVGKAAPSIA